MLFVVILIISHTQSRPLDWASHVGFLLSHFQFLSFPSVESVDGLPRCRRTSVPAPKLPAPCFFLLPSSLFPAT